MLDNENVNKKVQFEDCSVKRCCLTSTKNMTLYDIALKLNYVEEWDEKDDIAYIATSGTYLKYQYWNNIGKLCDCDCDICSKKDDNKEEKKKIWREFLSRNKCLYCGKKYDTSYAKPYCIKCYRLDKDDDLRKKLLWIENINKSNECNDKCEFCYREGATWWFGGFRKICKGRIKQYCEKIKYLSEHNCYLNNYDILI
jgi:hypothetical protein